MGFDVQFRNLVCYSKRLAKQIVYHNEYLKNAIKDKELVLEELAEKKNYYDEVTSYIDDLRDEFDGLIIERVRNKDDAHAVKKINKKLKEIKNQIQIA